MKAIMTILMVLAMTALLAGCAGMATALTGNEDTKGIGSYDYEVGPDCNTTVNVRSLRGGPSVQVTRVDGNAPDAPRDNAPPGQGVACQVTVTPPTQAIDRLKELLPLLQ